MAKSTLYNVKNRSTGTVSYSIPEDRIKRHFAVGEVKRITEEELEKLSYQPGGRILILNYLQIEDIEMVENLNIPAEQEYWYSENEIIRLLESGSVDELLDCLDFAPSGVIDLLKKYAIELPVNDFRKREAIFEKTGFNITKTLENIANEKEEESNQKTETPKRRVKNEESVQEEPSAKRRVKTEGPSTQKEVKEAITPVVKTIKISKKDEE